MYCKVKQIANKIMYLLLIHIKTPLKSSKQIILLIFLWFMEREIQMKCTKCIGLHTYLNNSKN